MHTKIYLKHSTVNSDYNEILGKHASYTTLKAVMNVGSKPLWNFFENHCQHHTYCTAFQQSIHRSFHLPVVFSYQYQKQATDYNLSSNKFPTSLWENELYFVSYCYILVYFLLVFFMLSQSVSYFVSYSVLLHAKMDFHFEKTLIFIVQISGIQLRLPVFSIIIEACHSGAEEWISY